MVTTPIQWHQRSVATRLKCGEIVHDSFIVIFPQSNRWNNFDNQ